MNIVMKKLICKVCSHEDGDFDLERSPQDEADFVDVECRNVENNDEEIRRARVEGKCRFGKKGKKVSILGFRKVKRSVLRRKQKGNSNSVGPSRAAYGQCFSCLKPPRDMDSQTQSQASDPNSPDFGYDMLRVLIEKNDFYSKECNPHLDEQFVPSCPHQTVVNTFWNSFQRLFEKFKQNFLLQCLKCWFSFERWEYGTKPSAFERTVVPVGKLTLGGVSLPAKPERTKEP
nr:uncharacterized protein LOC107774801 [Ipomoea batatas]